MNKSRFELKLEIAAQILSALIINPTLIGPGETHIGKVAELTEKLCSEIDKITK